MSWFTTRKGGKRGATSPQINNKRPAIEKLEDRCLLAYTITDLGAFDGPSGPGLASYAYGINDAGTTVGQSMVSGFRYSHAYSHTDGGGLTDLGVLNNKFSRAEDISASGAIVGSSTYFANSPTLWHAFSYIGGVRKDLGGLGGPISFGTGINDSGVIVGYSNYPAGPADKYNAARWNLDGTKTNLGTLGGNDSKAYDINNAGQVVGAATDSGGVEHAVLWDGANKINIGVLPGSEVGSEARAINSFGKVVGGSYGIFGQHMTTVYRAFLYDNGVLTDLGDLGTGGKYAFAYDINDSGEIVGWGNTAASDSPKHAWVWQSGVMKDLNLEIPAGTGWLLVAAYGINNNGQIVGYGLKDGQIRAFKLTPTPSPIGGSGRNVDAAGANAARIRMPRPLVEVPTTFRTSTDIPASGHFAIEVCPGDDTPQLVENTMRPAIKRAAPAPQVTWAVVATAKIDETTTLNPFATGAELA